MVCRDHCDQSFKSERTFGRFPFGPAKMRSGLHGTIRPVAAVLASFLDRFGVVGGIAQHDHLRLFRQRQFADQIGCRLGCGAVGPARLLAVLVRIIGLAERNPNARRRDQEAHREAVAILLSVFLLAVATPFAGPPLAVARAVGVFGFLTCLTVQRGVDEEEEEAVAGLLFQQLLPQDRVDIEFPPPWPRQETADLGPVSRLAAHRPSRPQAGHPPRVQQERDDHADDQKLGAVPQSKPCGPPLETRKRIGDHDHGEAPSLAGDIRMI